MQLIYEKSCPGRRAVRFDALDVPEAALPSELCRREAALLPEVAEIDVVRHFTHLSQRNFGIDSHFYPLGSCTMKYSGSPRCPVTPGCIRRPTRPMRRARSN